MIPSLSAHLPYLWLVTASLIAGGMNALAAGGSFISFPAMIAIGVPPIQANATNTVALWPGQLTSIWALRTDLRRDLLSVVVSAAILGGIGGAVVLLHTRPRTFMHIVPWMLLAASLLFWISSPISRWLRRRSDTPHAARTPAMLPLFFALLVVNFYIGYFGAGAGFLIITVLSLFGFQDLHEINALKVVSTTLANGIAVVIFSVSGKVVWPYCLLAMVVCAIGGYSSARLARRVPQPVLRGLVVFIGLSMAAFFFWRNP